MALPALRTLQAMPAQVRADVASFLDLVPGTPQTQALQAELCATPHTVRSEQPCFGRPPRLALAC